MDPHKTHQDYQNVQGCASRISRVTHDWSQKLSEAFALLACMEGLVQCSREDQDTSGALVGEGEQHITAGVLARFSCPQQGRAIALILG